MKTSTTNLHNAALRRQNNKQKNTRGKKDVDV